MVRNAPIVAMFVPSRVELTTCFPGMTLGLEDIRPASFLKATTEPVNVIPPALLALLCKRMPSQLTDENTQISRHHMQCRDVGNFSKHTTNTGEDSSKSHNRVKSSDRLRKISCSNSTADHSSYTDIRTILEDKTNAHLPTSEPIPATTPN